LVVNLKHIFYIKEKAMKKRMSRREKEERMVPDMINEMFRIAGHSVTYDDVKDRKDNWFQEWTMTEAQYDEWKKWGKKYLIKNFRYYAVYAERQMAMIGLMWGLKFSDLKFTTDEQDTAN
jgi:hypothetical protein